jgi:hypothetical protein
VDAAKLLCILTVKSYSLLQIQGFSEGSQICLYKDPKWSDHAFRDHRLRVAAPLPHARVRPATSGPALMTATPAGRPCRPRSPKDPDPGTQGLEGAVAWTPKRDQDASHD